MAAPRRRTFTAFFVGSLRHWWQIIPFPGRRSYLCVGGSLLNRAQFLDGALIAGKQIWIGGDTLVDC